MNGLTCWRCGPAGPVMITPGSRTGLRSGRSPRDARGGRASAAATADPGRQPADHHHAGCLPATPLAGPRGRRGHRARQDQPPWRASRTCAPRGRRDTRPLRPRAPGEPVHPARHADDPPRSRAGPSTSRPDRTTPRTGGRLTPAWLCQVRVPGRQVSSGT